MKINTYRWKYKNTILHREQLKKNQNSQKSHNKIEKKLKKGLKGFENIILNINIYKNIYILYTYTYFKITLTIAFLS